LQARNKKVVARKLGSATSGAKALGSKKSFIAALKALRHPKSTQNRPKIEFSADYKAVVDCAALTARLEAAPFQNEAHTSSLSATTRTRVLAAKVVTPLSVRLLFALPSVICETDD